MLSIITVSKWYLEGSRNPFQVFIKQHPYYSKQNIFWMNNQAKRNSWFNKKTCYFFCGNQFKKKQNKLSQFTVSVLLKNSD